jgi:hypothetical protein
MASWKLPALVAAIVVPVIAAFYLGGPAVGAFVGALAAVGLILAAVRQRPRGPLGSAPETGAPRRILLVLAGALEGSEAGAGIAALVGDSGDAEVVVLAPARIGFLDRWASDVEGARREAQRRLVLTVATLAAAGIEAEARVGDEDLVQAVEDQLRSFAATDVILVGPADEEDDGVARAAAELRSRLRSEFRRVALSGPSAD